MKKASLLFTCLLAFTYTVVAQGPTAPPRTPNPATQQLRDAIRDMTPEQRTRVRKRIHAILEERRAREQRAAPTSEQYAVPDPSTVTLSVEVSPTFCVFGCAPLVVGQERAPIRREPGPVEQNSSFIRDMTPEHRARVRGRILALLDEQRANEQRDAPTLDQHPLPSAVDLTVGPSANLSEDRAAREFLLPGLIERGRQRANAQSNAGNVLNIPEGFTHPLDGVSKSLDGLGRLDINLEGFNERIEGATNRAIGALNQIQQPAANQPPVSRPADDTLPSRTLAPAASAASRRPRPDDPTPAGVATAARAGRRNAASPYSPPLPPSDHRIGNRAENPVTGKRDFGIKPGTVLYDSRGNPRGVIDLSRPNRKNHTQLSYGGERMIKLPSGEWKRAYDSFSVYLMYGELSSGLILEEDFNVKPRMPSLMAPPPPDRGQTAYRMTGGDTDSAPWKLNGVTLKVNPGVKHPGENSTDYGLRNGEYVNLCYSVPGTVRGGGGQCYDTFKAGTTFYREKSVHSIPAKLYKPGEDVPVPGVELKFLYGYVETPTGKRYGWVPLEALQKK